MTEEALTKELDEIEKTQGGRGLRQKLEAVLAENRSAMSELTTLKAEKVIRDSGFSTVRVEDLAGVPLDQLDEKAAALHEERQAAKRQVAEELLAAQGLSETEVKERVEQLLGGASGPDSQDDALGRLKQISQIGAPAPAVSADRLHGVDAMAAAFDGA